MEAPLFDDAAAKVLRLHKTNCPIAGTTFPKGNIFNAKNAAWRPIEAPILPVFN
jgi:hypothetical protein